MDENCSQVEIDLVVDQVLDRLHQAVHLHLHQVVEQNLWALLLVLA